MSIQDIAAKIISQAEMKASQTQKDAQMKAEEIKELLQKEADKKCADSEQKTEEKKQKALKKAEALAHMEAKSQILNKKQAAVDVVLQSVISSLASMPAKEYEQCMSALLKQVDVESAVVYPAKGKESSTKGAVKISGKNFTLGESRDFSGGMIIESKLADFDLRFETLVTQAHKKDLEMMIVEKIFA